MNLTEEQKKKLDKARDHWRWMWDEGFATDEAVDYHDYVEDFLKSLGIQ